MSHKLLREQIEKKYNINIVIYSERSEKLRKLRPILVISQLFPFFSIKFLLEIIS